MDVHCTNLFTFCMFDIFFYSIFIILQDRHLRGIKILFTPAFLHRNSLTLGTTPPPPARSQGQCILPAPSGHSPISLLSCLLL